MYGLGSFVKKAVRKVTKPITKVAGKLVPKEIAGIMRTAAPFLPAGYREAAYLLGTAKQTGRISPIDLALTAAPAFFSKTDLGKGIAQRVGDFTLPGMETNLRELTLGAPEVKGINESIQASPMGRTTVLEGVGAKDATSGILGQGGKFFQFGAKDSPKILDTKAGQFLLGGDDGKFSKAKLAGVGLSTLSLIQNSKTPQEAGEALVAQTGNSDDYERGVQLFSALPQGIFDIPEAYRLPVAAANGGLMRTNYAIGSDDPKPLPNDPTEPVNPFKPQPIGPVLPDRKMAGMDRKDRAMELADMLAQEEFGQDFYDLDIRTQMKIYQIALDMIDEGGNAMGGLPNNRMDLALGTKPTPEESGLGGLPIEADMRYTGGFMPYGEKEKADDVPARLSKNEFVFTADAVRAAGGGSVNEGAKKMYTAMKQLEKKPEAKGMMA
jgi:hypothetical protein